MPFPANLNEMKNGGYKFLDFGECRGCSASIEWWLTPKGRKIPMNLMPIGSSEAIAHFSTCTTVDEFRTQKAGTR